MATKVIINPGACGFTATVVVKKKEEDDKFSVTITTECPMGSKLGTEIAELAMGDVFKSFLNNPVYRKAAACLKHAACPVPSGILKALEVEAGLNVKKEVSITFVVDEE
jgi:hypothetical protein